MLLLFRCCTADTKGPVILVSTLTMNRGQNNPCRRYSLTLAVTKYFKKETKLSPIISVDPNEYSSPLFAYRYQLVKLVVLIGYRLLIETDSISPRP